MPPSPEHGVVAVVAADVVVALAAAQDVVAVLAVDRIRQQAAGKRVVGVGAVDGLVLGLDGDRLEDRGADRAARELAEVRRAAQPVEARVVDGRIGEDRALAAAAAGDDTHERRQREQLGRVDVDDVEARPAVVEVGRVGARAAVQDVVAVAAAHAVL